MPPKFAPQYRRRAFAGDGPPVIPPYRNTGPGGVCDPDRPAPPTMPGDVWKPGNVFEPPPQAWAKDGFLSILHSTLTLQAQQAGTPALLPLAAPSDTPLLIDMIAWEVTLTNPALATTLAWGSVLEQGIQCGFTLGKVPLSGALQGGLALTAGQIPLKLFSPTRVWLASNTVAVTTPYARRAEWHPRHPIYVPAGFVLQPTLENLGYFGLALQVRTIYVVRLQAPGWTPPSPLRMPYVTAFAAPTIVRDGNPVSFTSDSKDLANPFDVPFHVDHVTGECVLAQATVGALVLMEPVANLGPVGALDVAITASGGQQVVRPVPAVPFAQVFPVERHAMYVKPFVMQPQSYMTATIGCNQAVAGNPPFLLRAVVALSGWREVTL